MPWSGGAFTRTNGVHTGATLWAQDRDAGTKILAARHDTHDQDLATGINSTLEKSGSNAATGNLNIGSNRLTAVADGTAKTDAATVNQIQSNAPAFQASDTGTANAHAIALSPAITAYAAGQAITFKSASASTTASTLNVNGLGTKALKKKNDQAIAAGDIESGSIVTAVYDGTNFQVTSQLGSEAGAGGSNTQVQYNSSGSLAGDADLTFNGTNLTVANPLYLPDGAVATPSLANTGDLNSGIFFPAADNVGVVAGGTEKWRFGGNLTTSRNLLLNGGFQVWQRGTSFTSVGASATTYVADGWALRTAGSTPQARLTVTRDTTVPKVGGYSIKMDTTTAEAAIASGENLKLATLIESQDLQHLGWGSGGALRDISVSFWFRSPKTGIHNVYIYQTSAAAGGAGRSMVKEFSVAVANTYEFFSLTFAADSGGGFSNVTTQGLELGFPIVCSTSLQATADTWTTANKYCTSNVQNLADSTANDIYVADVQLECGPSTDFDYLPYGTTLAKCLRYYERQNFQDYSYQIIEVGHTNAGTQSKTIWHFATKRAIPTVTMTAAGTFTWYDSADGYETPASVAAEQASSYGIVVIKCGLDGSAAVGAGRLARNSTSTTYLEASAEL